MGLISTIEGSTTQLASIKDGSTINEHSTKQDRGIKGVDANDNEFDKVVVI